MKIIIIASVSSNHIIGRSGQLPWNIPEDLNHFKQATMGHFVLMGRKTYDSIGGLLSGRRTIVITSGCSTPFEKNENLIYVNNPNAGIEFAKQAGAEKLFVCGGGNIYRQMIDSADELLITEIDSNIEGDTFFPEIKESIWTRKEQGIIAGHKLALYIRSSRKNLLS